MKANILILFFLSNYFLFGQQLINPTLSDGSSTSNKWILHTPSTDNLIIAPRLSNDSSWDWSKLTAFGTNGNVGIGAYPSSNEKLIVGGSINIINNSGIYPRLGFNVHDNFMINNVAIANYGMTLSKFDTSANVGPTVSLSGYQGLNFYTNSSERMRITNSGIVNIGSIPISTNSLYSNYKLFVQGGILTSELRIAPVVGGNWADYVFDENYKLKPLSEVEDFILKNKHLPNFPSAEQVEQDGINIGDMTRIQQEKIEELTLYIIEQNKLINTLNKRLEVLEEKVTK